jgi:hypothetical protein
VSHEDPNGFGWADLRRADGDPRPPGPLVVVLAFVVLLGWVGIGSLFNAHQAVLIVGVLVIAALSSWWLTVPASLGLGTIAFLIMNGFVQNSRGELSWNGGPDLLLLLACLLLPALSAELGFEVVRERGRRRDTVEVGRGPGMDG